MGIRLHALALRAMRVVGVPVPQQPLLPAAVRGVAQRLQRAMKKRETAEEVAVAGFG